jgi:hypothetical protein
MEKCILHQKCLNFSNHFLLLFIHFNIINIQKIIIYHFLNQTIINVIILLQKY